MTFALTVDGLGASYGKVRILHDVSFSVAPGEIFGLIGINGAGKSTMIKIMVGLKTAKVGRTTIFGGCSSEPEARKDMFFLPENFMPPRYETGIEYLRHTLRFFGLSCDRTQAESMAARLALDPMCLGRRISSYSKGMGQKLGLLSALLPQRRLLVLDEPMSGLDAQARLLFKDLIVEQSQAGASVFFSSHILADIEEVCHRIAIIHQGGLAFLGTSAELMELVKTSNLERAFLGVIDGRLGDGRPDAPN